MTTFVLATHNAHKVEELRRILGERLGPHELIGYDGPEPVEDGDTFEARVHLWQGLDITTRVRLRGVDAPELKARCLAESRMAQAARGTLTALLAEGGVTIYNVGPDKYNGRVVADVATRTTPNVSAALIAAGHGRPYNGGHRAGWCG